MISHSKKKNYHNRQSIAVGAGNEAPETVDPTPLNSIKITTPIYTAKDVDDIISQLIIVGKKGIVIPDQEIEGDYYAVQIRSGRMVVKKVDGPEG